MSKDKPTLEETLAGINKEHGANSIMRLGEEGSLEPPEVVSTGSIALDEALRVGGFPRGRVIEIYGPESSGKTSVALHATGNAQRQGLRAAFIDAEHALDPEWATTLGVDTDNLYVTQPDYGEQGLQIADRLVTSGHFGFIVIDSVAALVPKAELEGEIGDTHVALQARMMSQALRKLTGAASETKTAVVFINQLRDKVGVFFGSSETQPGGKALKFYASVRLDVRRVQTLKDKDVPVGSRVKVKVVKNKVGRPFGVAEFDFYFDCGIRKAGELLDLGLERKCGVTKSGAYWKLDGESAAIQGREAAMHWLEENPKAAAALEAAIRDRPALVTLTSRGSAIEMEGPAPWEGDASSDT